MAKLELKSLLRKLNAYCSGALENAAGLCVGRSHYEVTVDHVLLKMLDQPNADLQVILRHFEIEPSRVVGALQHNVESLRTGNTGKPVFSPLLSGWFKDAWMLSSITLGEPLLRSGSLLLTLLENPARYLVGGEILEFEGIDEAILERDFAEIIATSDETEQAADAAQAAPAGAKAAGAPAGDTALGRFCIDFTARARVGEIDPVFGRDREIRQMIDILGRRRKNNPIVVGEPGVGKTAVVEGLALRIAQGDVPSIIRDVSLLVLDLGLLQAGAGVKGEFENRLKGVISEVKASAKPIILFIDEAHTMIGAGGGAGGSDAANLLKPALARGELRTIAATTWSEYKKYFEKDPALARRFQLVKLEEPSVAETVVMLRGLRERYEDAHGIEIPDAALVAASELSGRYISGRLLPDKAVDLVDTAAARVKISLTSRPESVEDLDRQIQTLARERDAYRRDLAAKAQPDDERVTDLGAQIESLTKDLEVMTDRWLKEKDAVDRYLALRNEVLGKGNGEGTEAGEEAKGEASGDAKTAEPKPVSGASPGSVTDIAPEQRAKLEAAMGELSEAQGKDPLIPLEVNPEVVAKVVADWTGIPIGKMVKDEAGAILTFADRLKERIKGQAYAVDAVSNGIRAAKAGVQDPSKPIGVFLFVGPSGVGKTETALGVADLLFGGERFIVTINMSEFQEKHTVSRLIGSPPGYVGFGEGGMLTEAVRQRPYSVVLLDEVEKADPEVMNLFYQVFDKGMLSDGEGRLIDFKNTVVFMTSNLATDTLTEIGLQDNPPSHEDVTSAIRPILNKHFKPALVGRMTIVPFFPLKSDSIKRIVVLKMNRLVDRMMESHKMTLAYDEAVVDQVTSRCTEVETGARNIDNILQGTLLPRISTEILERMTQGPLPETLTLGIDKKGEFTFSFSEDTVEEKS